MVKSFFLGSEIGVFYLCCFTVRFFTVVVLNCDGAEVAIASLSFYCKRSAGVVNFLNTSSLEFFRRIESAAPFIVKGTSFFYRDGDRNVAIIILASS